MKPLYYSYLITLLLFIGVNYCFGQAQNQEVTPYTTLYPFEENGWYGLIDSVGRVVIEAQFSAIWPDDFFYGSDFSIEKLNREIAYTWDQRSKEYQDAIKYNKTELIKKRKRIIPEAPTSPSKLLFLPFKHHAFYFLNEWAVVRIDDNYGYINSKEEILLNVSDSLKTAIRNSNSKTNRKEESNYWEQAEKTKNKIELLHPNKYEYLKPLINHPHFIIANQKIKGTVKVGLLKLDTLKNKIETIIPFNVRSIYDGKYEGLVKVGDEQGIRLFKLSDKTFLTPVFTGLGHGLNGYIAAQVNHKWGVIDSLGNWLYPPRLDYRPAFRKDLISIINNEKKVGLQENGQFKFTNSDFEIMGKYGYQSNLSIFHLNGKYGIINTATKDTVLAPDYDDFYFDTHAHSGGLEFSVANKIIKNKKVGLINLAGKLIAPCIYTKINELSRYRKDERHFFRVKINNKQGIIDHEGNEILAPKYDEIKHINNETYAFKKGKKWGYVYLRQESPLNEKKVVSPKYTSIRVDNGKILYTTKREEKEKVLNLIPKPIIRNLKFTHQTSLGETFILFQNAGEPLGIYNSQTKKIIIPPTYDSYTKLNNSHLVSLKKGQKYSVFNYRTGNTYHKNKFDYIASPYATTGANLTHKFHSSYSTCKAVKIDDKWGLMNAKGEIILEAKAKKMPRLNEENLFEIQINNHNHLVDTTGKIVLTTEIKKAPTGYGSCIPFQEDNLWGLKNADGEIIFDAEFRYWPKLNKQNLFEIYIDGRFHHVDTIGKIVLATDFTDISPTENSGKKMVMFKTDSNLWGVADSNFQVIFHPQFELYKFKHNWFLQVQKQEKWYWLKPDFTLGDTDSIPKFKPNGYPNFGYDLAYPYKYNLSSPYFIVIKNDKKGLIDTLGKEIIAPEYERIFVLSDTLAVVKKEKKYGVLNLQTKTLQQPIILACLEIWLTLS